MATEQAFMGEEVNWKKMMLLFLQRIWIIVCMGVAGAVIGSSLYLLIAVVFSGPTKYKVDGGFYIEFAEGMLEAHDYYNAYTWNSVVHQDQIMDATMNALQAAGVSGIERTYVADSIQADILSDVRYLCLAVTCDDPEKASLIFDACELALIQFGQNMKEFDSISVTHQPEPQAIIVPVMTWRAGTIGTTIGIFLAVFALMLSNLVDDSIYLQEELHDRYDLYVFGTISKASKKQSKLDLNWSKHCENELQNNISYRLNKSEQIAFIPVVDYMQEQTDISTISMLSDITEIAIESCFMPQKEEGFNKLRACDGIILGIPYGAKNGKLIRKYIDELQKQDCKIVGAILIEADARFQRKYYQSCFRKG